MGDKDSKVKVDTPLFRKEALQKNSGATALGKNIIIAPISFSIWSFGLFSLAIVLILFLYFGKYTRRQEVHGMLVPDKGIVNIYAKKQGIIASKFIEQGDEVQKGQLLYLVSTEQHDLSEESVSIQLIESLEKQIEVQKNRIILLEKNVARYKQLLEQQLASLAEYQKQHDTYLASKMALHDLEYRLNEVKSSSNYAIRAPADGTISLSTGVIGDLVTERNLLISIIPKGAELQGVLYVPSKAIGFIKTGQKVLLKYQAYPYQQFGLYESTIERIDKSILSSDDIKVPINLNVPFYRVVVTLKQQTVTVYGKPYPLIAGMLFEGIALGEERRLWQWIMDPIFSLKGSMT